MAETGIMARAKRERDALLTRQQDELGSLRRKLVRYASATGFVWGRCCVANAAEIEDSTWNSTQLSKNELHLCHGVILVIALQQHVLSVVQH